MPAAWRGHHTDANDGLRAMKRRRAISHPLGKNPGDVWQLTVSSYRGAHFATYPEHLVERILHAACPQQRCAVCRAPYIQPLRRSGTTATRLGRHWLGVEINPAFVALAHGRIRQARRQAAATTVPPQK